MAWKQQISSEFFDSLATNSCHLLILGDFNIHWDCQRNADTKQLADILRYSNLRQHVLERTHRHSYILDLVISRDDKNLITSVSVSSMLSDHFLVNINVSLQKQSVSVKVISYRRYKSIDKKAFLADFRVSSLVLDPPDDVDHLVDLYDSTLRDIVDEHTPLRTKEMPSRPILCVHFEMFKVNKRLVKISLPLLNLNIIIKRSKHPSEIKGLFSVLWIKYYIKVKLSSQ